MKNLIIAFVLFLSSPYLFAQLKLHNTGRISMATVTPPSLHNTIYIYGPRMMFGGWNNHFFKFDCSPWDFRMWSSSNKIAFYNTEEEVHCSIEAKAFLVASDKRYKTDIATIESALDQVLNMNGVSYHWKNNDTELKSAEKQPLTYGFIAQEVEAIIPELVQTDSAGYKTMDYLGVLPYVVESIKELNTKVEAQNSYIQELEAQINYPTTSSSSLVIERNEAKLFSNQPNPFKESTEIGYFVPPTTKKALIGIYDLTGKLIKSKAITNFGAGSVTITGGELSPGIFLYNLIVDGIEIDSKRLIVLE